MINVEYHPTWDAHHWFIDRRDQYTDDQWARIVARPDWTEHARADLAEAQICDRCLDGARKARRCST